MDEQLQDQRLIWVDLEMTGLVPESDQIIEIATVVTDGELNEIAEGPVIAIHQPDVVLETMDEWNTTQHGQSGLTERVRASRVSVAEAEARTLAFLAQHAAPRTSPMCGNSICQDRRFMARLMPALEAFFHYRNLDVSSVKILAALWNRPVADGVKKTSSHLALDDIRDSIEELRHYREHFLVSADEQAT
jgi:oligoribonuclease